MAIYHYHASIVSRASGKSVMQSLAYVLKEKAHDEQLDRDFDYSKKSQEVVHRETMLPDGAREKYRNMSDEEVWNDLQKREKHPKAQLAQRIDFTLPRELSRARQIQLAREIAQSFVDDGQAVTFAIHDTGNGNPHVDMLVGPRSWDKAKNDWGKKSHFVPTLDKNGNMIVNEKYKPGTGQHKIKGHDIHNFANVEEKRILFEKISNRYLEEAGLRERIDHRTLKKQHEEQYDLARKAEKRGDLEKMLKHDLKASELDRTPTQHEFRRDGRPASLTKKKNAAAREANAQRTKRLKKKVRDEYWRKRHQQDQQRRRHPQRRAAYIRSVADSSLSQSMQTQRRQPDRDLQRLFADSKPAAQGEGLQYVFCACKRDAARVLGISTQELDHRAAVDLVETMEKRSGKKVPYKQRGKLIKMLEDAHSRQDGICVVTKPMKTAGKAANTAIKASVAMLQATEQMIEAVRGLVGAIPLIGKPLSVALGVAEAPLKVTRKIGDAITKRAGKLLGNRREQPQRGGGQGRQDGGRQPQQQEPQERDGGGLPVNAADLDKKERNNGLDDWKLLSEVARADIEMEDFLAEVFGGGGRSRN